MGRRSLYTLLAIAAGCAFWWASANVDVRAVEAFYGIAQTPETEVNFNYPIEVRQVKVRAGDVVDSGQVLLIAERARAQERVADQDFRIEGLRAEQAVDRQRLVRELNRLEADYSAESTELREEKNQIKADLSYRRRLVASVGGDTTNAVYRPLEIRIASIDTELEALKKAYDLRRDDFNREIALAGRPADAEQRRLRAERQFEIDQSAVRVEVKAPAPGVVGEVNVKIGEHKSSFSPLLTFYEPNPTQVLSYIHEDKVFRAAVGDSILVSSLMHPTHRTRGIITGMGSRIIEIPNRLRRMPDIPTYGREIVVRLPPGNL